MSRGIDVTEVLIRAYRGRAIGYEEQVCAHTRGPVNRGI